MKNKNTMHLATAKLSKRFFAYLLDYYLGLLLCSLPIVLANGIINHDERMQMNLYFFDNDPIVLFAVAIISLLFGYFYYLYIPVKKWKGQTLGKRLLKIKIIKIDNDDVDFKSMILRQVLGIFLIEGSIISCSSVLRQLATFITNINFVDLGMNIGIVITSISCLMIFVTRKRSMIHDLIAKTYVVEALDN
ncbi:MAG: RDD family protein [Erysipelotrichaceae bacterium]|nr:RDD family protein [Erysipelotrichaceae bacterium]MDY5252777.1 RDD family protein [Erysipelotrichaceae bacterium]